MITLRKALTGSIAALALSATVLATATPASADWRGHRRGGNGGAIAAGIIGGLALGALAAGAARADTRTYYAPAPAPVYVPSYSYSYGGCYEVEKPAYNRWGEFRGYRLVTVCD